MAKKPESSRWSPKEVPLAELDVVWKKLLFFGKEYAEIAIALRKAGHETIRITGKDSADRGLGYLKSWLRTLRNVADEIKIDSQAAIDQTYREAMEEERKSGTQTGTPKRTK